jgi:hypothetical protein
MAVYTTGSGLTILAAAMYEPVYRLARLLLDHSSWTLYGSGDGASVGGPGVDAWDAPAKANTATSWMCVNCPGSTIQLLFTRYSATVYNWRVYVDRLGAYTGGTYNTLPTSASAVLMFEGAMGLASGDQRMHALVETGATLATSGFVYGLHSIGDTTATNTTFAFVPMLNFPAYETNPWVLYRYAGNFDWLSIGYLLGDTVTVNGFKSLHWLDNSLRGFGACGWAGAGGNEDYGAPFAMQRLKQQSNNIPLFPVVFSRLLSESATYYSYKGVSTFMQWNGNLMASYDTPNSRACIALGNAMFTWDGTSVPLPS